MEAEGSTRRCDSEQLFKISPLGLLAPSQLLPVFWMLWVVVGQAGEVVVVAAAPREVVLSPVGGVANSWLGVQGSPLLVPFGSGVPLCYA